MVSIAHAQVIVGPNVNMGGGPASFTPPSTIIGDPFLQRQNEPSIAVSSRNPCHLLAGANDYRLVDLEEAAGEVGDAWLGVFKSLDCGATWTSTVMPGHKLDNSPQGLAAPIKGLAAGADPTVRAGTSGLFYYSGIAFNRGDGEVGKVFVARFIDNNNKDGGDPIEYLGMRQIDIGTSGQFLDKPWIVADIPRAGSTCVINGREVPAGNVYLIYTSFVGGDSNVRTKILFSRSLDCGNTWSNPSKLSEGFAKNQGTTIAIDPGTGDIHVAWRQFAQTGDSQSFNAIMVARSTNGGVNFTKAEAITTGGYQLTPFDQASSALTFRTNAYPTIAVVPAVAEGRPASAKGRVYVAWASRGFDGDSAPPDNARIVMSSAIGGTGWTAPRVADSYAGAGHQIMPTMAVAGGRVALAYYDLRDDKSGEFEDLVFEYTYDAYLECLNAPGGGSLTFSQIVACMVSKPNALSKRHTLDMRAALAGADCLAAGACDLSSQSVLGGSTRVSRYPEGRGEVNGPRVQLQYNRPNLPIFSKGRFPFIGDYIDIAGQSFVANADGTWSWNTGHTANRPAPVFHVSWADNRNVGTPRNSNWEIFTPPVPGIASPVVACIPGQVGVRNQDVYTSQLRPSLIVSAPQNSKRISGLQRAFVLIAQNTTDAEHDYVLRATPPAGVVASFDQFAGFGTGTALTEITVRIPRKSSISRTLFVGLVSAPSDPNAAPDVLVPVSVEQLDDPPGAQVADILFLNPDFDSPDAATDNSEVHNPDFEDLDSSAFSDPDFDAFTLSATNSIRNVDFENPDFDNAVFANPDFDNPDFDNPDFDNPDFDNPDFDNPDFDNPDFDNPDFDNPDFDNGSFQVSDTTWPVRNNGNTTSAYKANVYVDSPPDGVRYQLAVRRIFTSPAAICAAPTTPTTVPETAASVPLVNIVSPNVQTNPFDRNFNDPSRGNATFTLAPGERGIITLRAYCSEGNTSCTRDLMASLEGRVALGVVAQGANCARCTGANCTSGDLIGGFTECVIEDGPPKDIYDPLGPSITVLDPTETTPDIRFIVADADGSGAEGVDFTLEVTDNVGVAEVTCVAPGVTVITEVTHTGAIWSFQGEFPVGTFGVTCTAKDLRQPEPNENEVAFLVAVTNVAAPTFNLDGFVPPPTVEATGPNGAIVVYESPTATTAGGSPATVVCESESGLASGNTFPIATTEINCVATDASAGVSTPPTKLFNIVVADTTPPQLTVPANITGVQATSSAGAVVTFVASATDSVDGPRTVVCLPASGTVFALGSTTVTCTASDLAGHTASESFIVTVGDSTPPAFGTIANVTVEATSGTGAVVSYATPTATDSVDAAVAVMCAPASGATFALGSSTVTCTAVDDAGNQSQAAFTVTVRDTTPPQLTVPANITGVQATSSTGATVTFAASANDSVDGLRTVVCLPASGSVFPLGSTTVTCTASDLAGNLASRLFTVTVVDTIAPVITEAANPATLLWSPNKIMTPVTISGTITDATLVSARFTVKDEYNKRYTEPSGSITVSPTGAYSFVVNLEAYRNGNDDNGRVYTITVTATDAANLTSTRSTTVLVPHNQ